MSVYANQIKSFIESRTEYQRVFIIIGMLFILWLIWQIIWASSIEAEEQSLNQQIQALTIQVSTITQRIKSFNTVSESTADMQQRAVLENQLFTINQQLVKVSQQMISPKQMTLALKMILVQYPELTLLRLENVDVQPLDYPGAANAKNTMPQLLYKHGFVIEFYGTYFATLRYLLQLERLPWRLYWDSINYQVTTFPQADITIKLHTISSQENLLNA